MEKSFLYAKITVPKKIVSKLSFKYLYRSFIFIELYNNATNTH